MKITMNLIYTTVGLMTVIMGFLTADGYIEMEEITATAAYGMSLVFFGFSIVVVGWCYFHFDKIYDRIKKEEAAREADMNTTNHRLNCYVELLTNRVESLDRKVNKKDP